MANATMQRTSKHPLAQRKAITQGILWVNKIVQYLFFLLKRKRSKEPKSIQMYEDNCFKVILFHVSEVGTQKKVGASVMKEYCIKHASQNKTGNQISIETMCLSSSK